MPALRWRVLPAILSPVPGTAGWAMHLLVQGKGQVRPAVLGRGASAASLRGGRPLRPRGTSRGPRAGPAGACGPGPASGSGPGGNGGLSPPPVAGAAPGLPGADSAERSVTGLLGTETHAGRSVLTAGHPCHDEGPGLPQGSRRRFSLS